MSATVIEPRADVKQSVVRIPGLIYGGDYNPEQWPESVWAEDAELMRQAGVNLVSLGIFAWARLEPAPGRFAFDWLDRVIDLLHQQGVSVNLATPTASPPPWLVRQHPEILPVTADGVTLWHGSRRHYCPHSEPYREAARRIARALAEHYRGHPAVVLWHVDNEYGCHVGECFCDASAAAFRGWLRRRYASLDDLNQAWGTAFWSQGYTAWEEIEPPRRAPTFINPSQLLDWQRFSSDSWRDCFTDQAAILREVTPEVPVTTNFMHFHKAVDYFAWAPHEDIVANDFYPDTSDPEWMIDSGMACDLMRSVGGGRPWMLMEQATGHVNWRQRNATKAPGVMRLGSLQAVARGADAIMFFQWRASRAGAERYHSAMIPHAGTSTRTWREVTALGAELGGLSGVLGSRVQSEVGILFDWESWWALESPDRPSQDVRVMPLVRDWYAALYRRNVTTDFVHPSGDLSKYRVLVAPALYLLDDVAIASLRSWVSGGGTLVMSFFSGIVDANDHIRLGGYPAGLTDALGLVVEEFAPHGDHRGNHVRTGEGSEFGAGLWSDVIRLDGADALATYADDWLAGAPAVTEHRFGQGTAIYVGTRLDAAGTAWVADRAIRSAGMEVGPDAPAGVEIVRRVGETQSWTFVLNHSDTALEVTLADGSVAVGAKDVVVVSR